jgi:hypothetical protein
VRQLYRTGQHKLLSEQRIAYVKHIRIKLAMTIRGRRIARPLRCGRQDTRSSRKAYRELGAFLKDDALSLLRKVNRQETRGKIENACAKHRGANYCHYFQEIPALTVLRLAHDYYSTSSNKR